MFLSGSSLGRNVADCYELLVSDLSHKMGLHQAVFMRIFNLRIKMSEWKHRKFEKTLKYCKEIFTLEGAGKGGVSTKDIYK